MLQQPNGMSSAVSRALTVLKENLVHYSEPFKIAFDLSLSSVIKSMDCEKLMIKDAIMYRVTSNGQASETIVIFKCEPLRDPNVPHIMLLETQYVAWPVPKTQDLGKLKELLPHLQEKLFHDQNDNQQNFKHFIVENDPVHEAHIQGGKAVYTLVQPLRPIVSDNSERNPSFSSHVDAHVYLTGGGVTNELAPDFTNFKTYDSHMSLEINDGRQWLSPAPRQSFTVTYHANMLDTVPQAADHRVFRCQTEHDYTIAVTVTEGRQIIHTLTTTRDANSDNAAAILQKIKGYGAFGLDFGNRANTQRVTYVWNEAPVLDSTVDYGCVENKNAEKLGLITGVDDNAGGHFRVFIDPSYYERQFQLVLVNAQGQRVTPYLKWYFDDQQKKYWTILPTQQQAVAHQKNRYRYESDIRVVGIENNSDIRIRTKSLAIGVSLIDKFGIATSVQSMELELFQGGHKF